MQYIEFKIVNTKLMAMGGGDPVKQMEERTAYLDKIRAEAIEKEKSGGYQYQAEWNPFPKFVREIIKAMAEANHTKAKYDDENDIFRIKIQGERYEYDEFYDEFQKRFSEAKDLTEENSKWSAENIVHVTSTPDDENAAMFDLETYQRGASLPPSRMPKKGV